MLTNKSKYKLFSFTIKRTFTFRPPTMSVRIKKENDPDIPAKPIDQVQFKSGFHINPENIDDYVIIGAEIFKNYFKDVTNKFQKNGSAMLEKYDSELVEKEVYEPKFNKLAFQEPDKYIKNFIRRPYYDHSDAKFRHMFVPSYRYKIEPFNSRYIYRFSMINGNRKEHNEYIFKRNNFIKAFNPPFNINNHDLEQIFNSFQELQQKYNLDFNSEQLHNILNDIYNSPYDRKEEHIQAYVALIDKTIELISSCSHQSIPPFIMRFFFELGLNDKRLWNVLEQEILDKLHHFTVDEICQIYYASQISAPKFSTENFRRIIVDTVTKMVETNKLSLEELFTICFGMRSSRNLYLYDRIGDNFINRIDQFVPKGKDDTDNIAPSNLSKIFYAFASHKPKNFGVNTFYSQKERIEKFIDIYEESLLNNILKMNGDDLFRLATSLYLLKSDNVDHFVSRIERNLIRNKTQNNKIEPFVLTNVLRAFSKMKDNKTVGSDKFFNEMEPLVIEHIKNAQYNFTDFSHIIYSYVIRGSGSEKLYEIFNKHINEHITTKANSYHILHNLCYYLMITDNKNPEVWNALMKNYNQIEERIPIYFYRSFRLAGFYLEGLISDQIFSNKFDHLGFAEFKDRFWDPEQIYDYVKNENLFFKSPEYNNFKDILNARLFMYPICHAIYDNVFIVHFSMEHKKLGINLWLPRDEVPKTENGTRINKLHLLHSKILRFQGWDILDLSWNEFLNLGSQTERDKFIYNWFHSKSIDQEKKGIAPYIYKYV